MPDLAGGQHLLDYWEVVRRRRWVFFLALGTTVLLALLATFLATPLYRATVTLQIERQTPDVLSFRDLARTDYSWAAYQDFYQTQYKIMASQSVARRAADALRLTSHPLLESAPATPSLLARLRSLFPGTPPRAETDPLAIAARFVLANLQIAPIRNSHLVQISWISPDPDLAAQVAQGMADAYIRFNIESQYKSTGPAKDFLAEQIADLTKEIDQFESRLQDYGQSKRIVSIDDSNNITLKALSDISQKRTEAQTVLAQREAALKAVREAPAEALPEVLQSNLIARLKEEYAGYEAQYSEMASLFKADWPQMHTLASKLEQAKQRLALETRSIQQQVLMAADKEYRKALEEVRGLDALLRQHEEAAQTLKRDAVQFANLKAEIQKKRETLNVLIARQNEMALSTKLQDSDERLSNIRIVDEARVPNAPFRPNKKLNLALGLVFGLGLGLGLAFFLDYLDNTVSTAAEIDRTVHLPTLAVVPRLGGGAVVGRMRRRGTDADEGALDLIAHADGRADASEAYRELRTAILLSNPGQAPRQMLVTSALPEEGKSATAVNLAIVLAQLGRRVLVVDTDLRRPRLHRIFDLTNGWGISTYLSGMESEPERLVLPTGVDHLGLVPSGPIPPNPSELLNSPQFAQIGARYLDLGYDHIVYDSPPALSVSDPVIIASVVDIAILVVRAGQTPRQSLQLAVDKFVQAGARPIGVVLNGVDVAGAGYRYYRSYGRYGQADSPAPKKASGVGSV